MMLYFTVVANSSKTLETVNNNNDVFASALSEMIIDFYTKKSNTILFIDCAVNKRDVDHRTTLENVLADLDAMTSALDDCYYSDDYFGFINNIIFIDCYESWR